MISYCFVQLMFIWRYKSKIEHLTSLFYNLLSSSDSYSFDMSMWTMTMLNTCVELLCVFSTAFAFVDQ